MRSSCSEWLKVSHSETTNRPLRNNCFRVAGSFGDCFSFLPVFEDLPNRHFLLLLLQGPQGPSLSPFSRQCLLSPLLIPGHHLSLGLCPPTWAAQGPVSPWATQPVSPEHNPLHLTLGPLGRTTPAFPRGQTPSLLRMCHEATSPGRSVCVCAQVRECKPGVCAHA